MISWIDWGIWLLYFSCFALALVLYMNSKKKDYYRFFLPGFIIKTFGSVVFALVYVYYYKFGDSFEYFKGAVSLSNAMIDNPSVYLDLLFSEPSTNFDGEMNEYAGSLAYSDTPEEWFMVKLLSPLALLSFRSYLVLNLFMGFISFIGSWKLFKVFLDILPQKRNVAFICAFMIPSVVFWGSGIMKDTLTLLGVNYMIYIVYFWVIKKQYRLKYVFIFALLFFITFKLKSYIVIAILPGFLLTIFFNMRSRITSSVIRILSGPIILIFFISVSYLSLSYLSESSGKYRVSQIEWKVKGFHSWHTDLGGSSYSLGEIEYTPTGVIKKIPESLNVTFFRPYVWEARNPVVLLGALESLAVFVLFLSTFFAFFIQSWRSRRLHLRGSLFRIISTFILTIWRSLSKESLLRGMLIFILIFGFAIGFTSYNFGALGRYKIPIFSLFVFTLFYVRYQSKYLLNTMK